MSEKEKREFKGIWFPAEVWLDERLTALEKMILMEIDSLDNEDNCYASNEHLAKFCQCSQSKVSSAISKLKKLGYVRVKSFDGRKRILESCLTVSIRQTNKKEKSAQQNLEERVLVETTSESTSSYKTKKHPTIEDVKAHVQEKGYHFDPQEFFDYYEAGNWTLGNGKKVTSWKRCCVTWESTWKKQNPKVQQKGRLNDYNYR